MKHSTRAKFDTMTVILEHAHLVHFNVVVPRIKAALGHKEKSYGNRFHLAPLDEDGSLRIGAFFARRFQLTVQNPTYDNMLAISKMPGLIGSPRVEQLDVAVDFCGLDSESRFELQRALSLTFQGNYHELTDEDDLDGQTNLPRQVYKDRRVQTLFIVARHLDAPTGFGSPYNSMMRTGVPTSNYFGSEQSGLETCIYAKEFDEVLKVNGVKVKKPLPEHQKTVRVEVRLWKSKLIELLGIEMLDDLLAFKPSGFARFFKFAVCIMRAPNFDRVTSRRLFDMNFQRAQAGAFAYQEAYGDVVSRGAGGIRRRRRKQVCRAYANFNRRCSNALNALTDEWESVQGRIDRG